MRNSSRSWWLLAVFAVLAACGGDDDDDTGRGAGLAPPTCQPDGILRYVHDLGGAQVTGELPKGSSVFANKVSADEPGYLEVGDLGGTLGGDRVRVAFQKLIAKGDSTAASGFFKIGSLEAGNCETALASRIHALPDDGWTVTLVDLHASPYCSGAAIAGSFAACFIPEPF
jgi:hypothetical protein